MDEDSVYEDNLSVLNKSAPNQTNHIRLLRPSRSDPTSKSWKLKTFSIQKAPQFAALSYSWGNRPADTPICINTGTIERHVHISKDVSNCLKRLRDINQLEWLWIDALCINQASNQEKSHQVTIMRSIYAAAKLVYVWLGESIRDNGYYTGRGPVDTYTETPIHYISREDLQKAGLSEAKLADLIRQDRWVWWERLWVIQEVVSCDHIFVCIGSHVTAWDRFWSTFASVSHYYQFQRPAFDPEVARRLMESASTLVYLRNKLRKLRHGEPLIYLLRVTSSSGVSRPEDRIYSLLGLATEKDRRNIPVDYDKSIADIFSNVVSNCILHTKRLDILFYGWPRGEGETSKILEGNTTGRQAMLPNHNLSVLSSWMPNFLQPCSDNSGLFRFRHFTPTRVMTPNIRFDSTWFQDFKASQSTNPRVRFESTSLYMHALPCGVIVDSVPFESLETAFAGTTPFEALLSANSSCNDSWEVRDRYLSPLEWTSIQYFSRNNSRCNLVKPMALIEMLDLLRNTRSDPDTAAVAGICFITDCGLIGFAEYQLYVGDDIIVPFGSTVPAVVRPSSEAELNQHVHALVGPCYVHGVMDGELMTLYNSRKVKSKRYHLK